MSCQRTYLTSTSISSLKKEMSRILFVVRKLSLMLKPDDDQRTILLRELRAFEDFIMISCRTLQVGSKITNGFFECRPPEWCEAPNDVYVLKRLLTGPLHKYCLGYVYKRWRLFFSKERRCIRNDVDKYTANTLFLDYCFNTLEDRFEYLRVKRKAIGSLTAAA